MEGGGVKIVPAVALRMMLAAIVVISMLAGTARAQCSNTLQTLLPCLPAVQGDAPPKPTKACCDAIDLVNAECLCNTLGTSFLPGMNITAALQLPKDCGCIVPRGSTCAGYPVPSSDDQA